MSISYNFSASLSPAPQASVIMTPSTSGNSTRGVSGNIIVIYILFKSVHAAKPGKKIEFKSETLHYVLLCCRHAWNTSVQHFKPCEKI